MRPSAKLAAYALVVAAAMGGGAALGSAVGPIGSDGDGSNPPAGDGAEEPTEHVQHEGARP